MRRAGGKVRVTGQLIDARTDEHLWAKKYDRDLTDIFALQSELAQAIASELKLALSPQEKSLIERRPTENLAAYDLYLQVREGRRGLNLNRQTMKELLERALRLDPNFVEAWVELAYVESFKYQYNTSSSEQLALARKAIDTAVRLAPDSPDVILGLGEFYYRCYLDFPRALERFEKLARLRPNDARGIALIAAIQRRQGRWTESLGSFRTAVQLDPGWIMNAGDLASVLAAGRRFEEARAQQRRIVERLPDNLEEKFVLAYSSFVATGGTKEVEDFFARLPADTVNSDLGIGLRKHWALVHGDVAEAVRLDRIKPYSNAGETRECQALKMAVGLAAQGDVGAARARLEDFPATLTAKVEREPNQSLSWAILGQMEALLGHKEDALRCARRAMELSPESRDAWFGARCRAALAFVEAWTGDKEAAIANYARLLRMPYGSWNAGNWSFSTLATIHVMKHDSMYAPLRGDPRFEALLNDPKNNAPLF